MIPYQLIAAHEAQTLGVNPATVRQWARRLRLQPRALDTHGHPLYLAADIAQLRDLRNPGNMAHCHTESPVGLCPQTGTTGSSRTR